MQAGTRVSPESHEQHLQTEAWWLADLATELSMPITTLHRWRSVGWVRLRKVTAVRGRWAIFADAGELDRLRRLVEPYKPWQRGSNEHTNGLLRQYDPKGTDFSNISRHHLKRTTIELNDRPRKRLNYQTPSEVFTKRLAVAFEK